MFKRATLVPAIAILAALAAPAQSADLDNIIYAPMLPETKPVEIGSGWYLRGDIGYTKSASDAAASFSDFVDGTPDEYVATGYDSSDLKTDWTGTIGVGYAFTDYFRADATLDFGFGRFSGSSMSDDPCVGGPADTTCMSTDGADYKTYSLMANGYFDLGTFAGFTPYVGGGVGMTNVRWDDLGRTNRCVDGGDVCDETIVSSERHTGENDWRFTYALMAGMSYDITDQLKLDLGYRYQNIDSGPMAGYSADETGQGATGVQLHDAGIETHEIRAGLRYELW
ncbi:porin family protein [Pseudohoeflea suaedae]|uniref:Porin family protein n=1 Tax=Pseudohoeflea suaedae TaxID=877384 RepID=A0A4R5PJY9_9HYPH|nr:outer membrane protein [Pseudohoeflea suaedae]TDH35130.1 porin family protein [Pseudohoeflea suaedae]